MMQSLSRYSGSAGLSMPSGIHGACSSDDDHQGAGPKPATIIGALNAVGPSRTHHYKGAVRPRGVAFDSEMRASTRAVSPHPAIDRFSSVTGRPCY